MDSSEATLLPVALPPPIDASGKPRKTQQFYKKQNALLTIFRQQNAALAARRAKNRRHSSPLPIGGGEGTHSAGGGGGGGGGGGDGGVGKLKLSRRKESDASVRSSTVCASGHW